MLPALIKMREELPDFIGVEGEQIPVEVEKGAIRRKVIWLDRGVMVAMGEPQEVIEQYLAPSKIKRPPMDEELPDVA